VDTKAVKQVAAVVLIFSTAAFPFTLGALRAVVAVAWLGGFAAFAVARLNE
jgi:hypothetical protein